MNDCLFRRTCISSYTLNDDDDDDNDDDDDDDDDNDE